MRIRKNKKIILKKLKTIIDEEANQFKGFEEEGLEVYANVSPLNNKLYYEIYGARVNEMLKVLVDSNMDCFEIGDGIQIYSDKVDYTIVSVKRYSHLVLEVQKYGAF